MTGADDVLRRGGSAARGSRPGTCAAARAVAMAAYLGICGGGWWWCCWLPALCAAWSALERALWECRRSDGWMPLASPICGGVAAGFAGALVVAPSSEDGMIGLWPKLRAAWGLSLAPCGSAVDNSENSSEKGGRLI